MPQQHLNKVLNSGTPIPVLSLVRVPEKGEEDLDMKFLVILCFLALTAADEDKAQEKKTQPVDVTTNASSLTQPSNNLLNGQVFLPSSFPNVFSTNEPVSSLAYTGLNGNVSPIQTINPDFFVSPASGVVAGPIPSFPITRTVLPGTSAVVNGIQSAFPVAGNVFPAVAAVNAIPSQFSTVGGGIPAIGPNAAAVNAPVSGTAFRILTPEALSGVASQSLQAGQQVGLATLPTFPTGILPSLTNTVLQGQKLPTGIQQVLKNPTASPIGVPNVQGLNTGNIFRTAESFSN